MSCPGCGTELRGGQDRCAACGAVIAPPVEGALATKLEPLRELPGTRKKEKSWREEVNERMRSRRKKRESEAGLPLFDAVQDAAEEAPPRAPAEPPSPGPALPEGRLDDTRLEGVVEQPVADLPLRGAEEPAPASAETAAAAPVLEPSPSDEREWTLELEPEAPARRPVERPAAVRERALAGFVDVLLWGALCGIVAYFAGRAARVPILGLRPAWPWLVGYFAFLGLAYATYFTGTTGQTPGKMMLGLRVVDTAGRPPGYLRAFVRAALGGLGVLAAGLGLVPIAFDPALRALHDRACRTRLISG